MRPWMNGTTITMDSQNRIQSFNVTSNKFTQGTHYKTVNIYSFSEKSWNKIVEQLELYIASGKVNEYYEVIFKKLLADGSLSMEGVLFDSKFWYEIDTPDDLLKAERTLENTHT